MDPDTDTLAGNLRDVFQGLDPLGNVIPDTPIPPNGEGKIDTVLFIRAFLRWAISPSSIAEDILARLKAAGLQDNWSVEGLMNDIENKRPFQEAMMSWSEFWCMNFLFPMLDKTERQMRSGSPERFDELRKLVAARDSNRCVVTRVYDILDESVDETHEFGSLALVYIVPYMFRRHKLALQLLEIFSGGTINAEKISGANADNPRNAILLSESVASSFTDFQWSALPSRSSEVIDRSNEFVLIPVTDRQVSDINAQKKMNIHLRFCEGKSGNDIEGPDPDLFRLHCTVARICKTSKAPKPILRLQEIESVMSEDNRAVLGDGYTGEEAKEHKLALDMLTRKLTWASDLEDVAGSNDNQPEAAGPSRTEEEED